MTPAQTLRQLAQQAVSYGDQAAKAMSSGYHGPGATLAGGFLAHAVVPHGLKGLARGAGRYVKRASKANVNVQWLQAGHQFLAQCEASLREMSIATRQLPAAGNSHRLVLRLNRVRRLTVATTFFGTLATVLEEMSNLDLLWTRDIPVELQRRREGAERERRAQAELRTSSPHLLRLSKTVDAYNRLEIAKRLERYPTVQQSLLGALDRLHEGGPDAERHCLLSSRSAIEALCIQAGGHGDWKEGLKVLLPSETDQKQVQGVVHYLGGKVHGGHVPTRPEAEHGLRLTISTMEFLSDHVPREQATTR